MSIWIYAIVILRKDWCQGSDEPTNISYSPSPTTTRGKNVRLESRGKLWKAWSLFGIRRSVIIRSTRERYLRCGTEWKCTCWIADSKGYGWRTADESSRGERGEGAVEDGVEAIARGDEEARRGGGGQNVAELNGSSRGCSLSASLLIAGCGAVQSTPRNGARHAAIRSSELARRPRWCPWIPTLNPHTSSPSCCRILIAKPEINLRTVRRCVSRGGRSRRFAESRIVTPAFYVIAVTSCNSTRREGRNYGDNWDDPEGSRGDDVSRLWEKTSRKLARAGERLILRARKKKSRTMRERERDPVAASWQKVDGKKERNVATIWETE